MHPATRVGVADSDGVMVRTPAPARAMLFLYWHSFANRVRSQAARVRSPRYLIAVALGALYLYWALFRNARMGAAPLAGILTSDITLGVASTASTLLLVSSARWWIFGADRSALAFTPSEVQFLFPAPVSRRGLIQTKLLRMQLAIFVNTIIFSVVFRGHAAQLATWERGLGWWMLFSTLAMHRVGASIVRANAVEHGNSGRRKALLPVVIFGSLIAAVVFGIVTEIPALRAAASGGIKSLVAGITLALDAPVPRYALFPARVLIDPIMNSGTPAWTLSALWSGLIVVGHYFWVVRLDASFEEAAMDATAARVERIQRVRSSQMGQARSKKGKLARVPSLSLSGRPEVAIAWKNLAAALRGGAWRSQLIMFVLGLTTLAVVTRSASSRAGDAFVGVTIGWGAMLLFLGPLWMRFDLRLDLPRLAVLKTYPLPGWRIVLAEIAAVTLLHSITVWSLMSVPVVMFIQDPQLFLESGATVPILVSIVVGVPAFNALMFTIQNGTALLFPAWVRLGTETRGFETMGQNLLTTGATTLVAAVALVFPVGLGALVLWFTNDWGGWSVLAATLLASGIIIAELWPVLHWLGTVFDDTDVNEVVGSA
ncbi:putative ABC exporter domain-containing protein [Gemmatimonas sp.]|uniref:putative ABC exporter domain-containing protein n=1 Tax=Gemmatimonas sp. TaxID=1962908 RepID=UPI003F70CEC6